MTTRHLRKLATAATYGLSLILIWHVYVVSSDVPPFLLPGPTDVWLRFVQALGDGEIWPHVLYTLRNIIVGFLLGTVLGGFLGALITRKWWIDAAFSPFLVLFQAAPKIAIAPLFVLWFGLGLQSQLILIVSLVFFPMLTGMTLGLRSLDQSYLDLGRLLGLDGATRFWRIEFPAALPDVFAAARIGIIDAMTGAVLAEFISSERGLGYLLVYGNTTYQTGLLIVAIILVVLAGLTLYQVILMIERRAIRWHESQMVISTSG